MCCDWLGPPRPTPSHCRPKAKLQMVGGDESQMHRVALRFFGSSGQFKQAMDDHIEGRGLSDALSTELTAYEQVPLDETVAEGSHRDVNLVVSKSAASRLPFWSSTQRLPQNLQDYDESCSADAVGPRDLFTQCMRRWKAVLQLDASKERRFVGTRSKGSALIDKVYRCGASNQVGWSEFKQFANMGPRPFNMKAIAGDLNQMKRDFMHAILDRHGFFSFAREAASEVIAGAQGAAPPLPSAGPSQHRAQGSGGASSSSSAVVPLPHAPQRRELVVFQVLNTRPGNRVLAYNLDMKNASVPVQVQYFNVVHGDESVDGMAEELHLVPEGNPVIDDAIALGRWVDISLRLQKWETLERSPREGCLCLRGRRSAIHRPGWDPLRDEDYPAVLMIRTLRSRGWTMMAEGNYDHCAADQEKRFSISGIIARKSYLRCLLSLPGLWDQGLGRLCGGKHEMYYRAVLICPDKAAIADHLLVRDYRRMIKDSGVQHRLMDADAPTEVGPSLADAPAAMQIEAIAERGDDEGLVDLLLALIAEGDEGAVAAVEDEREPARALPPALVADLGGAAPAPEVDSASDSSSSASGSDDSGLVAEGPAVRHAPFKRIRLDLPTTIDGITLEENIHNEDGRQDTGQRYHRIAVRCPLSDTMHVDHLACKRYRNIGETTTRVYGRLEPVGYLGAWLRAGPRFRTRAEHMRHKPTIQEVEAYLTSVGLL